MKRSVIFLKVSLLALFWLSGANGTPEPQFAVRWTYAQGGQLIQPSKGLQRRLERCGIPFSLTGTMTPLNLKDLECEGVVHPQNSRAYINKVLNRLSFLQGLGVTRLGNLSLKHLEDSFSRIEILVSPQGVFEGLGDQSFVIRRMAVNVNWGSRHLVILNEPYWKAFKSSPLSDLIVLHESFGAVGINDQNYELSLLIWWLSENPKQVKTLLSQLSDLLSDITLPNDQEAGITLIGRGGDARELIFKGSLLEATKQIVFKFENDRGGPSLDKIQEVVLRSRIVTIDTDFLESRGLCGGFELGNPNAESVVSPNLCGGFVLEYKDGRPMIIISPDWGTRLREQDEHPLLHKVIHLIVGSLL